MIYVTHDQVEAMTMADRIVVMNYGNVLQIADPTSMFVAGFIGSPPMNFMHGKVISKNGALWFEEIGKEGRSGFSVKIDEEHARRLAAYEGKPIVFGIRPENMDDKLSAPDPNVIFPSTLEVIEPMGAETYLYLNTGAHSIIVGSQHFQAKTEVGHKIDLVANMKKPGISILRSSRRWPKRVLSVQFKVLSV